MARTATDVASCGGRGKNWLQTLVLLYTITHVPSPMNNIICDVTLNHKFFQPKGPNRTSEIHVKGKKKI